MNCDAGFRGVMLSAGVNPCAHRCRYCLVDQPDRGAPLPFERFAPVAERFVDWRVCNGGGLDVHVNMRHSSECSVERLRWLIGQRARSGHRMDSLLLGGLLLRTDADTRAWLDERRALGIRTVIATFAGLGENHDYWNGRAGDFSHLLQLLRAAAELGLDREERFFVTRHSLADLPALLRELDRLPGAPVKRVASLFMYRGRAERLESERITSEDFGALPAEVRAAVGPGRTWRSEAEWLEFVEGEPEVPISRLLHLRVDSATVAALGRRSCDEIVGVLVACTRASYAALPSRKELCATVGDRTNPRLYAGLADLDRLWLDRHLARHPTAFDRSLTEFSTW
jgi:hypothetical protein